MTREEKKRELKNYIFLDSYIEDLKDRYLQEFTKATKITSCNSGMPHASTNESKAERSAVKLLEVSERLRKAEERKTKIDKALEELKPRYRLCIYYLDIESMTISRLSRQIHRTYRDVIKLHNRALDEINL